MKRTSRSEVQFMKNYLVVNPDPFVWNDHWRGRDKDGSIPEFLSSELTLARRKTEFVLDLFEKYVTFI